MLYCRQISEAGGALLVTILKQRWLLTLQKTSLKLLKIKNLQRELGKIRKTHISLLSYRIGSAGQLPWWPGKLATTFGEISAQAVSVLANGIVGYKILWKEIY